MKKRFLTLILTLTAMLMCIFGLASCGGEAESGGSQSGAGNTEITVPVSSVSLNRTYITLEVGDTLSLSATISPSNATDKSVTWSSSNTSVATVSNGTVTAKSAGTTTITVKTSNNKIDSCYVTVNPKTIAVNSVTLNKTGATLEVGDTLSLTATIYPSNATNKSVTWSSSNTSVATVSNGLVTAKSSGSATITVRTNNNKTATCSITVNNPVVAVSSISLNQTGATIEVGVTLSLSATISPSNATDKSVTWSSSNTSVATVSDGIVTAKAAGTATITVKTSNNKTATCSVTVNEQAVLPTAIYLSKSSLELKEGATANLTVTFLPSNATNKTVEWLVLDTSVATASDGTVTAVGEGETTLIVTTSNGLTATCSISVTSLFVFEEYGSGYALTAYNGTATEVTVPSMYKGKDVIAIGSGKIENFQMVGDGFFRNALIKKVVLPNTIITINHGAFARCTELEQVEIPANVRKIGAFAFQDTAISVFTIPETVVECGEGIFLRCDKLKILSTPLGAHHFGRLFGASTFSANEEYVPKSLTTVVITSATKIVKNAFYGCKNIEKVILASDVICVESFAFFGCNKKISVYCEFETEPIVWGADWRCYGKTEYIDGWGNVYKTEYHYFYPSWGYEEET